MYGSVGIRFNIFAVKKHSSFHTVNFSHRERGKDSPAQRKFALNLHWNFFHHLWRQKKKAAKLSDILHCMKMNKNEREKVQWRLLFKSYCENIIFLPLQKSTVIAHFHCNSPIILLKQKTAKFIIKCFKSSYKILHKRGLIFLQKLNSRKAE